uniref:LPS-assembly protein LptD n=1 Tax=candidate division WOR-3 bacterium TaxID=2052148 RepID=A0A7V0Z5G9_UNCW3
MLFFLLFQINNDTLHTDSLNIVDYSAKMINYNLDSAIVILNDSAFISYRDIQLFSDSAYYYIDKKTLEAFGLCRLRQVNDSIKGTHLKYNLDTKKAMMDTGRTQIQKGFIEGKKIYWVEAKVVNAYDGKYTTCSDSPPHYYFYAPRMKVFLGDMVIARPIYLYIYDMPVIAAPFWFVPISSKRKSGLLPFKAGNSRAYGKFIRGFAYYYVISDYADLTLQIDAYEKKGIMPYLEGVWDYAPYTSGNFLIDYIKELDTKLTRYSIEARNNSPYFLFGSNFNCDLKYMSDNQYRSDYAETTIIWVDKEITSQATLNRDFGGIKNTVTLERRVDFGDTTTFEKIPYYTLTTPSRQLFSFLTYSFSGHIIYDRKFYPREKVEAGGANIHTSPSFKQNIFDLFSVAPGLDVDFAVFNEDTSGNKFPTRLGYSFFINSSTNLFRVYSIEILGLKGILHKVTPGISYNYTPNFDFGRFPAVYGIPGYAQLHNIGFGISQEFEAKIGEKNEKKNFAQISLNGGYNLINDTISPINYSLNLPLNPFPKPITVFNTRFGGTYNLYTREYTYTIDNGASIHMENFEININQTYTKDGKYQIGFNGKINPTQNWSISYSGRYDYELRRFVDYSLSLTRNLHCWEGVFSFSQFGNDWRYDFKVRIKEIPEVVIGRGLLGYLIE